MKKPYVLANVHLKMVHVCTHSVREAHWLIFKCPHCPDYERRINLLTGDVRIRGGNDDIRHCGYMPPAIPENTFCAN